MSSLANAMPEEIDEGLTGGFMEMHISVFKDLENEGLLNHFTAYDKDTFYPETITLYLNNILEKMIVQNPDQWIWTHNRWK